MKVSRQQRHKERLLRELVRFERESPTGALPDFVIMGVLLLGTGLMCELVMRKVNNIKYRVAMCGALLAALVLIWMEIVR